MQNAQTLSEELRGVIVSRLNRARPQQILAVAASLCAQDERSSEATPVVVTGLSERLEISGSVVTDHKTGLMWTRSNVGGKRFTWGEAKKWGSDIGGYADWRLPTIQELLSIVDYERASGPTINPVFECDASWYWTSTPVASSPSDYAWVVSFNLGYSSWYDQSGEGFVRAVRSSQ